MWYSIFFLKASTKCLSQKGGPELCVGEAHDLGGEDLFSRCSRGVSALP